MLRKFLNIVLCAVIVVRDSVYYFQPIFNRADYTYISDIDRLDRIARDILEKIATVRAEIDKVYADELKIFLSNLQSFASWINAQSVPELADGVATCLTEISTALAIFNEPAEKRAMFANKSNKMPRVFGGSISKIARGLRLAFSLDFLPLTNISTDQVCRYILDSNIGLGTQFRFNKRGNYAFASKICALNMQELLVVLRLLTNPSDAQIRTINKWRDLGAGKTVVRILVQHCLIRRDQVFFLYKANEHREYEDQLSKPPKSSDFDPV